MLLVSWEVRFSGLLGGAELADVRSTYGGYEYQILVTVWVALDLILTKKLTDSIAVEPPSFEDIEAELNVPPDDASSEVETKVQDFQLLIQVKSRSTGSWTPAPIGYVLHPQVGDNAKVRPSAIQLLAKDPRRRYVLITNAGISHDLMEYVTETWHEWPAKKVTELPGHAGEDLDATLEASVAGRVALRPQVSEELLYLRIMDILGVSGHIPGPDRAACLTDLMSEVRQRLLGKVGSHWTREQLIDALLRHNGSLRASRGFDHYVEPKNFDVIRRRLESEHAVIISGPPGTGKTLTANILEDDLRRATEPFSVVTAELGPTGVYSELARTGSVLFHVRDPWGSNEIGALASSWSEALPKLLEHRGPARKFLITTRSDVLRELGAATNDLLKRHIVGLSSEDYGAGRLDEIYERRCAHLSEAMRRFAVYHKGQVLKKLRRPFEVDRFFVALSEESPVSIRSVESIIAQSQFEAIAGVVSNQITGRRGALECAAFVWGLLVRRTVGVTTLTKLRRDLRRLESPLVLEVDNFIDWMVAASNITRVDNNIEFFHSQVEAGVRMALHQNAAKTEHVLSSLAEVLARSSEPADWGTETLVLLQRAVSKLPDIELDLLPDSRKKFDAYLLNSALRAKAREFGESLKNLASLGSQDSIAARFARALVNLVLDERRRVFGDDEWRPPEISDAEKSVWREDASVNQLFERFVVDMLPHSFTRYRTAIVPFLSAIRADVKAYFAKTLRELAKDEEPFHNIDAIVAGACGESIADLESALDVLATSGGPATMRTVEAEARLQQAIEHELDAGETEFVIDAAQDQFSNVSDAIDEIAKIRRRSHGVAWAVGHRYEGLLVPALVTDVVRGRPEPSTAELQVLISNAGDSSKALLWRAASLNAHSALLDLFNREFIRSDLTNAELRKALLEFLAAVRPDPDEFVRELADRLENSSSLRRLESAVDLASMRFDAQESEIKEGISIAYKLIECFPADVRSLGHAMLSLHNMHDPQKIVSALPASARDLLRTLLPEAPISILPALVRLASAVDIDTTEAAQRLLACHSAECGVAAIDSLTSADSAKSLMLIRAGLKHPRYLVRARALESAVSRVGIDRTDLLRAAEDKSADVRLKFASLMKEKRWPEALDPLLRLTGDQRDFNSDSPYNWPDHETAEYSVARAAIEAISHYGQLTTAALTTLKTLAGEPAYSDPRVPYEAERELERRGYLSQS